MSELKCSNNTANMRFDAAIPPYVEYYLGKPGKYSNKRHKSCLHNQLTHVADERVKQWMLLCSPWYLLTILSFYGLLIVGGKRFMKNRKPMDLKRLLVVYNFFQVMYSAYIFMEVLTSTYLGNYKWHCNAFDKSRSVSAMRVWFLKFVAHFASL